MKIKPTIAMQKGDSSLWLCRSCGCLCYITHPRKPTGPCPGCDKPASWKKETLPCGPFHPDLDPENEEREVGP